MPTYGYRCPACGHEYEKFQKINDDTRAKCPQCGKRGKRLISGGVGVLFKGSGFYETDYKRAGTKPEEKDSSDSAVKKKDGDKSANEKAKPPKAAKEGDGS